MCRSKVVSSSGWACRQMLAGGPWSRNVYGANLAMWPASLSTAVSDSPKMPSWTDSSYARCRTKSSSFSRMHSALNSRPSIGVKRAAKTVTAGVRRRGAAGGREYHRKLESSLVTVCVWKRGIKVCAQVARVWHPARLLFRNAQKKAQVPCSPSPACALPRAHT